MIEAVFLNTRPLGGQYRFGGNGFNDKTNLSITTLDLPLIEICTFEPEQLSSNAQITLQKLLTGFFSAIVVVSVHAAKRLVYYLQYYQKDACFLSDTTVIAVGHATQQALINMGIQAINPEDNGLPMNNEGMLGLDVVKNLTPNDHLLIIKGIGGRMLLHDTLVARGFGVFTLDSYQRKKPNNLLQNFTQIRPHIVNKTTFVLISSEFALNNWQSLNAKGDFIYLAFGDRLYRLVKQAYPKAWIVLVNNLQKSHIQHAVTNYLIDFRDDYAP